MNLFAKAKKTSSTSELKKSLPEKDPALNKNETIINIPTGKKIELIYNSLQTRYMDKIQKSRPINPMLNKISNMKLCEVNAIFG